jgi:hypothetical protein
LFARRHEAAKKPLASCRETKGSSVNFVNGCYTRLFNVNDDVAHDNDDDDNNSIDEPADISIVGSEFS